MYATLANVYGPQHWWPAQTPLEVIVGAYLTQNTSWRAVEKSIENLKAHNVLDLSGLRAISEEELRVLIQPSGFMQRKAAAIKAFIAFLDQEYAGSLVTLAAQETSTIREQLLALPGIGPETADAILLYALGHPVMVVDEYLRRLKTRHHLIHEKARYIEVQQLALHAFADDDVATRVQHYNEFHALVVELGKRHCRREPQCDGCPLSDSAYNPPFVGHNTSKRPRIAAAKR
jgi:endonuclease-3 related protein